MSLFVEIYSVQAKYIGIHKPLLYHGQQISVEVGRVGGDIRETGLMAMADSATKDIVDPKLNVILQLFLI